MDGEDGLYIAGRGKRFIIVHGRRISPDEPGARIMRDAGMVSVSAGADDHPVIRIADPDPEAPVMACIRVKSPAPPRRARRD